MVPDRFRLSIAERCRNWHRIRCASGAINARNGDNSHSTTANARSKEIVAVKIRLGRHVPHSRSRARSNRMSLAQSVNIPSALVASHTRATVPFAGVGQQIASRSRPSVFTRAFSLDGATRVREIGANVSWKEKFFNFSFQKKKEKRWLMLKR